MSVIYLHGEINLEMFHKLSKKLDIAVTDPAVDIIDIELASEGGSSYEALAIYGKLRACSKPTRVTAFGSCMSAATIVLAGATYRRCDSQTWIMVHDSTEASETTTEGKRRQYMQMEREEQQWADILAFHSATPAETWRQLSKQTTFLTAREAFQLGLVDEIMKGKPRA